MAEPPALQLSGPGSSAGGTGPSYPIMVSTGRFANLSVPSELTRADLKRVRAFLDFLEGGIEESQPSSNANLANEATSED